MKKPARFAFLLGIVLLLLVSCGSTRNVETFTDEQYDYALHLVLDQAQEKTMSDLFKHFNEFNEPMIPDDYSDIESHRAEIPGMDLLIRQWSEASTPFVLQIYGSFTDYVEILKGRITFRNPKALLEAGDESISALYSSLYFDDMVKMISQNINGMDFTPWRTMLIQYNAWASTRNRLYNEGNELLDADMKSGDLVSVFSKHLASLFFKHLAASESLIRTTPDLSMDPIEAMVLGLV